ncbi:ABC transporter permease [Clostridium sp. ATCC 25772]|uniref:ABC transporter permease n=1 Tax=Clostridium sp. ATCC 25772 TaxID=1676991 RepID=UPI000781CAC9|nr:ABC transporter permease [Clostridium sp. ATCC 25772]
MNLNKLAINNVLRDKLTYLAYFLSSVFSVFIFFSFSISMFHPDLGVISDGATLSLVMEAGNIIVYIFSFIFIAYSIKSFMHSRKKTLGTFIIMGASKKQLNNIIFKENMFIGIASIITAIILGLICSPFFLMISRNIMGVNEFKIYFPIKAIGLTFVMFFILFLIIAFITPKFIRKDKVIKLLKSDKISEKESKTSPLLMTIGVFIASILILLIAFYKKYEGIREFVNSQIGTTLMFVGALAVLYILYSQVSIFLISNLKSKKFYLRKTNMITISDIKSKLNSNTKMMYLVTVLFIGAFLAIDILYASSADIEKYTINAQPYSYTYMSLGNNDNEQEHIELIGNSLKDKVGYKKFKAEILYKDKDFRNGLISESDYNNLIEGVGGEKVSLKDNEVYLAKVSSEVITEDNSSKESMSLLGGNNYTIVGLGEKNIFPEGYFNTVIVVNDETLNTLNERENFNIIKDYSYNINNWQNESVLSKELKSKLVMGDVYKFGFFSANDILNVEKMVKNLTLYIGFFISIIFVIAALSIIYFRLITDIERERIKFKGIIKLGLSKKELSKIISTQNFILMFVPFIISTIITFIVMLILSANFSGSYIKAGVGCSIIFLVIEIIGYIIVNTKYKNSILEKNC